MSQLHQIHQIQTLKQNSLFYSFQTTTVLSNLHTLFEVLIFSPTSAISPIPTPKSPQSSNNKLKHQLSQINDFIHMTTTTISYTHIQTKTTAHYNTHITKTDNKYPSAMPKQTLPVSTPPPPSPPMLIKDDSFLLPSAALLVPSSSNDDNFVETNPLLPRSLSLNSTDDSVSSSVSSSFKQKQQRRRRTNSDTSLCAFSNGSGNRRQSFNQDVRRAASETYLITGLSFQLLSYLGVGYRWITKFLALGCYAFLLIPGFFQVGYYYFFSSQVRRGVVYGDQPRNRLDLYLPKCCDGPKPVVAFITGGAWIIGYKAWGSLLGQQLSERDIIVACIDYRNFPQGTISDMVKDASQGISFVCKNIAEYGGDPNRIYLMGQSAGAHIAACTLLEQAIKEAGEGDNISWSVSQIKAYFGLSGGYNLFNLVDHFHNRGLYRSIFLSIMEGEESLKRYSPAVMVREPDIKNAVSLLPPIVLFHGTGDYSIPADESKSFAETLQGVGMKAEAVLYEGKTHTDLFLQDPMRGGMDDLFEDLVALVHADDSEALEKDAVATPRKRLVPEFMLKLARKVSPF